jgi:membrane protease YdiL (CAAX protease family)
MTSASDPSFADETPSGEALTQSGQPDSSVPVVIAAEDTYAVEPARIPEAGGVEQTSPIEISGESLLASSETADVPVTERDLFADYEIVPPPPLPRRKPDFFDVMFFVILAFGAWLCAGALMLAAIHFHAFGVSNLEQANNEIHYRVGSQAVWYLVTVLFCVIIYPLIWRKSFFDGLQWRAGAAGRRIVRLIGAASACFAGAIVDEVLVPGPKNTPIDETFRMPGAVWILFAFGVTLAPLIEEIVYRGLLLPTLCTAWDWCREQLTRSAPLPLADDGFPRWSPGAMVFASVIVSVPFALMHAPQTAYSVGPFLLLVCISLVLCWVRLAVRSLAASVVVHACYNLMLFSVMFLGTGGFRHLDKM